MKEVSKDERPVSTLSKNTRVTFGLFLGVLAILATGATTALAWKSSIETRLTTVEVVGQDLASHRKEDEMVAKALLDAINEVKTSTAHMRGQLDFLIKEKK